MTLSALLRQEEVADQAIESVVALPSDIKSLAVLPFASLAAESRDEALELGMPDTLITKLTAIRQIRVRPTSAVRTYTEREQDPLAAGRELRVDAVLDGSIQKSGDRIRVTVRLLNVRDGSPLWAGQFDEKFTDIFSVQDAVSEKVSTALEAGARLSSLYRERRGL